MSNVVSIRPKRPLYIRVISREEGMPVDCVFGVVGWTGFDEPVVKIEEDDILLVLQRGDWERYPK